MSHIYGTGTARLPGDKYCPKCGRELEFKVQYVFGDPNLGVEWEGWFCSEHGHIKKEDIVREQD